MGDDAEAKQPKKPRYDTFAKEALGETLELLGTVSTHHEIAAEPQFGDLWFEPHPNPTTTHEPLMVLIARMAREQCAGLERRVDGDGIVTVAALPEIGGQSLQRQQKGEAPDACARSAGFQPVRGSRGCFSVSGAFIRW